MADKFNLDGFSVDSNDVCTADGGFVGDVTGDVTGDLTGTLTGKAIKQFTSYTLSGALDLSDDISSIFPVFEALAVTLADGVEGQVIEIVSANGSFNVVLTPDNLSGATTITFDATYEYARLIFQGSSWICYSTNATVA